jgi:hypothetical protein
MAMIIAVPQGKAACLNRRFKYRAPTEKCQFDLSVSLGNLMSPKMWFIWSKASRLSRSTSPPSAADMSAPRRTSAQLAANLLIQDWAFPPPNLSLSSAMMVTTWMTNTRSAKTSAALGTTGIQHGIFDLSRRDAHDVNGVADHIGRALLALSMRMLAMICRLLATRCCIS